MFMILCAIGAIASIFFALNYSWRSPSVAKTVVKTISFGAPAIAIAATGWDPIIVAALWCCVIGDYLLAKDTEDAMRGGIAAFALGHLLYSAAMMKYVGAVGPFQYGIISGLIVLGLSCEFWLTPHTGALNAAVRGYIVMILSMAAIASITQSIWLMVGAMLFVLSDLLIAVEVFRLKSEKYKFIASLTIWPLYVIAQICLLLGFYRLQFPL